MAVLGFIAADIPRLLGNPRKKDQYIYFSENFCACYSFFYDVVNTGEQLRPYTYLLPVISSDILIILLLKYTINVHFVRVCRCKHQLSTRLAASLGLYVEVKYLMRKLSKI
ncbi:hypothetical protein MTR_2g093710 [Medicago truncatula]|uniref:Uncharacterized protein n=1 Tax=Medicago truncatula TaxID=3880 RepID=G7IKR2_MEDTR|nr:hypothetical protein MTR_2g093710 [Medicago truncatula]